MYHFVTFEKVLYCFEYMKGKEYTWNTKGQKRVFNWFKI